MMRELVSLVLKSAGHCVMEAVDGDGGLRIAVSQLPDMIVSSLRLPGKDGLEILKELKSKPETSATPLIILTGDAQPADREKALGLGASAFLTKPIMPEALLNAILQCSRTRSVHP